VVLLELGGSEQCGTRCKSRDRNPTFSKRWFPDKVIILCVRWYLYRAVDERGRTVESYLSRTRDMAAAKALFRKALKHHGEPRTITLDGFEPSHAALRRMGMDNEFNFRWENPVKIRSCQYLNNIVEQDHRRVKFRTQPMLGFKSFYNASSRSPALASSFPWAT
jgi:transposase-like protein